MARIAFVLDRIFRKFGLSGKSFIPMLIGTGCGVPGIMASRTIENERDRRMTIMTTTFIPCGAKVPFISMVAGAIFGGAAWVATSAYFVGMAAIIISGIILKKTKMFSGDPAPFVMELPAYHLAHRGQRAPLHVGARLVLHQEGRHHHPAVHHRRLVHQLTLAGWTAPSRCSARIRSTAPSWPASAALIAWIFIPLGWGNWQAAVASITGLVAKENIVGTLGILYGGGDGTVYAELWALPSPASPATPSWCSTCCAPPASRPSAPSSAR